MNRGIAVTSMLLHSADAGAEIGRRVVEAGAGAPPDALILFVSPRYDYAELLNAVRVTGRPSVLVGCSSAGEFGNGLQAEGSVSGLALWSDEIVFSATLGRGLREDFAGAARELVAGLKGSGEATIPYKTALILTDALAGQVNELVDELTILTGGEYQFAGGGAGDDARFQQTFVFCDGQVATDAVVALEILSPRPVGIGVAHGWSPASSPLRVTDAEGSRVMSLNATPAAEVYEEYARQVGQRFDRADPLPFFLHHILGIETASGYRLRVPLRVGGDSSLVCAAEIPRHATVQLMRSSDALAIDAAERATRAALDQLGDQRPGAAIFFDCVATRLRLGDAFLRELGALQRLLGPTSFAGCNSYGQIARAHGQFGGYHNCTPVICLLPE